MENYDFFVKQILRQEPEIRVKSSLTSEQILRNVYWTEPRVSYYIERCAISRGSFGYSFSFTYRNQGYPLWLVYTPSQSDVPLLLRQTVAQNQCQCVLCLPKDMNLKGILERCRDRMTSAYPNLTSYTVSSEIHPYSLHTLHIINFKYRIGTVMLRKMELEVSREIRRLAALLFQPDMPDFVKCYIAHNYLATSIRYVDEDKGSPLERSYLQSAYGALINKKCVCHGYAEAYKRLLNEAHISCDIVLGQTNQERDSWHAWNIVTLQDGALCFHTDVTWDSRKGIADKRYFCCSDASMSREHIWDKNHYPVSKEPAGQLSLGMQAAVYCLKNRKKLLAAGLQPEWIT